MNDPDPKQDTKQYLFDKPRNVKRLLRGFYAVCVLLIGADLVYHRHVLHAWESIPGFYALYGLIACVVLVLIAKELRRILMRDPGYYDDDH